MRFANKVGLSAIAAALIIGPLLGAAVFFEARALLLEHIVHEQVQSAGIIMREIDTALHNAYQDVSAIAADELLAQVLDSPADGSQADMAADELAERERLSGPWDALAVFDVDGRVAFAPKPLGNETVISAYVTSEPGFRHALAGEIYYSDRLIRQSTGAPVVIFAAPVYRHADPPRVVGVVVAHYRWSGVQGILDRVDPLAWVHLLNRDGMIIAKRNHDTFSAPPMSPVMPLEAAGEPAGYVVAPHHTHGEGETLKVEVVQRGEGDFRGNGWRLLLERPSDQVFSPIREMATKTTLLVFGMLLVTAVVFAGLGHRFIQPLKRLVEGVRQVEQGRFDRTVAVASRDEFGELAESFNAMVGRLREAQDELVRKGRLAMLGEVAIGIGHELRNPLGVMSNAVYFLQSMHEGDGADDSVREYLGIIRDEIARSERIVAELMDAVHTRPPELAMHTVARLVDQVLRRCAVPPGVVVTQELPAALPAVRVDAVQIQQALDNLVANAVEAMPEGGRLEVSATVAAGGGRVIVGVRDSGAGIRPEDMARLFQPLVTTKARGIGLGLVVAGNLVEANGGTIEVVSDPGKGTVVFITLPAVYTDGI